MVAAALLLALLGAALGAALSDGLTSAPVQLAQQGVPLDGGAEEVGEGHFGRDVALSADGGTALVGAPNDDGNLGAAWAFTPSTSTSTPGSSWMQQGVKLIDGEEPSGAGQGEVVQRDVEAGGDEEEEASSSGESGEEVIGEGHFGRGVALSGDGNTALAGAPRENGGTGAVWVFTRSGSTWTRQQQLTGGDESGAGWFGRSVAISADGDTALVGGLVDHGDTGAVWVFTRSGSTWSQQGAKLLGGAEESSLGKFGASVALSANGEVALVGAPADASKLGAAWVFARSGSTWSQQGAKLTGGMEESGAGEFGASVALSANGEVALVGAPADASKLGAAWVFARSGSTWSQQGAKLTGGGEVGEGEFGNGVALSEDGALALIGAPGDASKLGAAWELTRSGSAWTQVGAKLTSAGEQGSGQFGWSVALSGDGATALIGGDGSDRRAGAAWVFASPPPATEPVSTTEPPLPPTTTGATATTAATSATTTRSATVSSPKQGVAAAKGAGGRVRLVSTTVAVRGNGRARVELRCISTTVCRGTLKLTIAAVRVKGRKRSRTTIGLGAATFSLRPGRVTIVALELSSAGRALLNVNAAAHGRLGARLTIVVSSPSPRRAQTHAVELVLRRPASRPRG